MMIGVVYAIVLGLAIAGVWEARNAADDVVQSEALALHEVQEGTHVLLRSVRRPGAHRRAQIRALHRPAGVAAHGGFR